MKTQKSEIKNQKQRQMLNDLYQNLKCEVSAYRKLLQFANEVQKALLSDRIECLLKAAAQQEKLAETLQAYEED